MVRAHGDAVECQGAPLCMLVVMVISSTTAASLDGGKVMCDAVLVCCKSQMGAGTGAAAQAYENMLMHGEAVAYPLAAEVCA